MQATVGGLTTLGFLHILGRPLSRPLFIAVGSNPDQRRGLPHRRLRGKPLAHRTQRVPEGCWSDTADQVHTHPFDVLVVLHGGDVRKRILGHREYPRSHPGAARRYERPKLQLMRHQGGSLTACAGDQTGLLGFPTWAAATTVFPLSGYCDTAKHTDRFVVRKGGGKKWASPVFQLQLLSSALAVTTERSASLGNQGVTRAACCWRAPALARTPHAPVHRSAVPHHHRRLSTAVPTAQTPATAPTLLGPRGRPAYGGRYSAFAIATTLVETRLPQMMGTREG